LFTSGANGECGRGGEIGKWGDEEIGRQGDGEIRR